MQVPNPGATIMAATYILLHPVSSVHEHPTGPKTEKSDNCTEDVVQGIQKKALKGLYACNIKPDRFNQDLAPAPGM